MNNTAQKTAENWPTQSEAMKSELNSGIIELELDQRRDSVDSMNSSSDDSQTSVSYSWPDLDMLYVDIFAISQAKMLP